MKTYAKHIPCPFIFALLSLNLFAQEQRTQETVYESFDISIHFKEIGYQSFPVLYQDPSILYLPIDNLFSFLKIYRNADSNGEIIEGYIESKKNTFEINYPKRTIIYQRETFSFSANDAIIDIGMLFLRKEVLERVFGFNIDFHFRSLSADLTADFELPIIKFLKLDKARKNLQKIRNELVYDTILPRSFHWLKFGMTDWSFSSTQAQSYTNETRLGLGLGAEIMGGETNISLNYSDRYGMNKYRQRYYWRYVDNQASIARQFQIGRINTRTISSLLSPVDGFMVSNTPTTVRKALGDYLISNYTEPDWLVELYINNVLIKFTTADASGMYSFKVPIVYGTNNITLRFYGHNGEERSEEKTLNMPYNILPKSEFEYKASGGVVLDSLNSTFGRVETNYGITRWLTAGAGIEYLSSIDHPEIPFMNVTFQPFAKLIFTGEYAHRVRTKSTLNYTFPSHTALALEYTRFKKEQQAIIYKYLEERVVKLSVPLNIKKISGYARSLFRQYVYPNFTYNTGELILSAYYRNYSGNYSNLFNWTNSNTFSVYGNLSFRIKFPQSYTLLPSAQYSYTNRKFISIKTELQKRINNRGYLSFGYENNLLSNYQSFNISLRYDLSCATTYLTTFFSNKQIQTSEGASGSFAFGGNNQAVYINKRSSVGRSGISIEPFIDTNFNNLKDKGEAFAPNLIVKCNGGQLIQSKTDSVLFIIGLEPFINYTLILNDSNFDNIAWLIENKSFKVCTDPNSFKKISVPVHPVGELSGMVLDASTRTGIGRILIHISDEKGKPISKFQSEYDGFFSFLGLRPGNYHASIDSQQLQLLKKTARTVSFTIRENKLGDIVDVGDIILLDISETKTRK